MKILQNFRFILLFFFASYIFLLFYNSNNLPTFIGDEKRYRTSVESLMDGYVDTNNHPLLAKTIWLGTVNTFYILSGTDMPVFWRFGNIVFSLLSLWIFYKILKNMFSNKEALFGCILLASDPMFFVFSRSLHLEIVMLFWSLLSLYFLLKFLRSNNNKDVLIGALFLGLSLATKLSALLVAIVVPVFLYISNSKRITSVIFKNILFFYFVLATFVLIGNSIYLVFNKNIFQFMLYNWTLFSEQFGLFNQTNIYQTSPAYTWFFIPQILSLYRINFLDSVNSVVAFQNPVVFMVSAFTVILTILGIMRKKWQKNKDTILVLLFFVGFFAPWFFNLRDTYYYYALPLYPLIIILFIKLVKLSKYSNIILETFCILSIIIFFIYFPITTGVKTPKIYDLVLYRYSQYHYPEVNRLFCQNCFPRK